MNNIFDNCKRFDSFRPVPLVLALSLFFAVFLVKQVPARGKQSTIAVLDLQPQGAAASDAAIMTSLIAKHLGDWGFFSVITMEEIRRLLEHEADKELLGCEDESCLAQIGGALGVELLIAGSLGKVGTTHVLTLSLFSVRRAEVLSREEATSSNGPEDIIAHIEKVVSRLMQPIIGKTTGSILITSSVEEAEVFIDEQLVGTTPRVEHRTTAGSHRVLVSKPGFISFAKDISLLPDQSIELNVPLQPSAAYRRRYTRLATVQRTLAWSLTAVAGLTTATSISLAIWNQNRLTKYRTDRRLYEEDPTGWDLDSLNQRADSINTVNGVTMGIGVAAAATGIGALVFWLIGDDPHRFDHDTPTDAASEIDAGITSEVDHEITLFPLISPQQAGICFGSRF